MVVAVAIIAGLLTACTIKTAVQDEDYVEVAALRTDISSVALAPLGDASVYQLNVEILPANATNRKLRYYIPSEYLDYVTVSNTGLLTAHKITDGKTVPLTVTSATNEKAKLTIGVIVEEVPVKSIRFHQDSLSLWYLGEPAEAWVDYYPSHASDGRSVTYESNNENVVTVETLENGHVLITPVGAGHAHVKATSVTTEQTVAEAQLPVVVEYKQAQCQLSVSGTPQWTQTINNFSAVNFTLRILGDSIDPNPDIKWWKGPYGGEDRGKHINGNDNLQQFTYIPDDTTPISYCIYVSVTFRGKESQPVWLYSNEITIYEDFVGFDLNYQNLSSVYTPYQYGDEAIFRLLESSTANTVSYNWYLQKMGGDGNEYFVANTPVNDRDLVRRMNIVGDYQMIVKAMSADNQPLKQEMFMFSSERFVVGDTLSVEPSVIGNGLPPDSYHWYYLPCNEAGDYDPSQKREIRSTAKGEMFYYPLRTAGYFRLLVTSTTNGVLSTVAQDGERVVYNHVSQLLRVYEASDSLAPQTDDLVDFDSAESHPFVVISDSRVSDLVIEGGQYMGENLLYVHWAPCAGVNRYEAELVFYDDNRVVILDSADKSIVFGDNYFYIPSKVAGFADKFSVRVKQKDGVYSDVCHYGIPNAQGAGDATHILQLQERLTPYFANITNNVNGYVTTLDELYDLVQYILLHQPSNNDLVKKGNVTLTEGEEEIFYDTFTVSFFSTLTYTAEMMNAFDVVIPDWIGNEFADMYSMICGEQQQGPYVVDFKITEISGKDDGGYVVTFAVPHGSLVTRFASPATVDKNPDVTSAFYSESPYKVIDIAYPIDNAMGVYVSTSDQMCYVMERGYRPVPSGNDELAELYKQIKWTYSSIIDEKMSDREKALAFYDWLCYSVSYDSATEILSGTKTRLEMNNYDSYHLEGIFTLKNVNARHALSDGYAKAFSALCALAGIPCRSAVAKTSATSYRVYNKVLLDGYWYVVDVAYGVAKSGTRVYPDHRCFLMDDEEYEQLCKDRTGRTPEIFGLLPDADVDYDFYVHASVRGRTVYVNSLQALDDLLNSVEREGVVAIEMECTSDVAASIAELRNKCSQTILVSGKHAEEFIDLTEEGGNLRAIVFLYDNE